MKEQNEVKREEPKPRNFSCAKYHAGWLAVMKFWWLIKCKKIYRLCTLPLLASSPFRRVPSISLPPALFLRLLVFLSFSCARFLFDPCEKKEKAAAWGGGIKFETRSNRLGASGKANAVGFLFYSLPFQCCSILKISFNLLSLFNTSLVIFNWRLGN